MIAFYSLLVSADSSRPTDQRRKCVIKACPFHKDAGAEVCSYHAHFFDFPMSLTGRQLDYSDMYKLDKDDSRWPMLSVSTHSEVFYKPYLRVLIKGEIQKPRDAYKDKDWGAIEAARRFMFAAIEDKPLPGKPNRLSTGSVILPTGATVNTVRSAPASSQPANQQHTGAFVLWKGFGKKKVRKTQRARPAGWHGNHPDQKPRDKWDRQTLDDLGAGDDVSRQMAVDRVLSLIGADENTRLKAANLG